MTLVKNFDQKDVAEALGLIMHMIEALADDNKPSTEDIRRVRDLAAEIKLSR